MATRGRDLRKAKRTPKRNAAWIGLASGGTPIPCVVWDISNTGARLAAPRSNHLPVAFNLLLSRDGKSRHVCRVVWRNDAHLGVEFVEGDAADLEVDPRVRRKTLNLGTAPKLDPASLILPGCGPRAAAKVAERRPFRLSSVAGGMVFVLGGATALFSLAAMQVALHKSWALAVCSSAGSFCTHPEWIGMAGAAMGIVYLTTRGMEF